MPAPVLALVQGEEDQEEPGVRFLGPGWLVSWLDYSEWEKVGRKVILDTISEIVQYEERLGLGSPILCTGGR